MEIMANSGSRWSLVLLYYYIIILLYYYIFMQSDSRCRRVPTHTSADNEIDIPYVYTQDLFGGAVLPGPGSRRLVGSWEAPRFRVPTRSPRAGYLGFSALPFHFPAFSFLFLFAVRSGCGTQGPAASPSFLKLSCHYFAYLPFAFLCA